MRYARKVRIDKETCFEAPLRSSQLTAKTPQVPLSIVKTCSEAVTLLIFVCRSLGREFKPKHADGDLFGRETRLASTEAGK